MMYALFFSKCVSLLHFFNQRLTLRFSFLEYLQDVFAGLDALELLQFDLALIFRITLLPDDVGIYIIQSQSGRKRCILIKSHTQNILKRIWVGLKRPWASFTFSQLEHAARLSFLLKAGRLFKALSEYRSLFAFGSSDDARLAYDL